MIASFPELYPDELVYSLFCRYYIRNGYLTLTDALDDLYINPRIPPDIEFINRLKPEVNSRLLDRLSMRNIILKHTMFPAYGRFLPKERREKAFNELLRQHGNFNNLLAVPKNQRGIGRVLRYCPLCAEEDRKLYGETYWHRQHQIEGIQLCYKHHCPLNYSTVPMNRRATPSFRAAELEVQSICSDADASDKAPYSVEKGGREIELTDYAAGIFDSDMETIADISAGEYLRQHLDHEKYDRAVSGATVSLEDIYGDYCRYYQGETRMTQQQMQKIFTGYRYNFLDICRLGLFEGIPAQDMAVLSCTGNQAGPQQAAYEYIAKQLGMDYGIVQKVGDAILQYYQSYGRVRRKSGPRAVWDRMDTDTLPKVQEAIRLFTQEGTERPRKVTISAMEKMMGFPPKRFDNLPLCRQAILQSMETQEAYWARETVWALHKLERTNDRVTWTAIRHLTNMRKADFMACQKYLSQYTDEETAAYLRSLI